MQRFFYKYNLILENKYLNILKNTYYFIKRQSGRHATNENFVINYLKRTGKKNFKGVFESFSFSLVWLSFQVNPSIFWKIVLFL